MNTTIEDARLLFDRWKDTAAPLQIKLMSSSLIFQGVGRVTDFAPESLQLGGDSWEFTIPLGEAGYSFSDPREIPVASVRDSEASKYEFGLSLHLASGDQLVLMELKSFQEDEE